MSPFVADPAVVPLEGWVDPEWVAALVQARHPHVFWLDAGPDAADGWSWIGYGPVEQDPRVVRETRCNDEPAPHAPPFVGGWVGWIGYEPGAERAGAPVSPGDADVAAEAWIRADAVLGFDHAAQRIWQVGPDADLAALVREAATATPEPASVPSSTTARARVTPDAYAAHIERCRDAIREGDAYQLCLTTRFEVTASVDPFDTYRRLRQATPAHHGGFVRVGDVALLSASPEQFLSVRGGVVRTKPIKGTRPRGMDADTDAALAAELRASPKEQAENVMIVDLVRNDLSRVSETGTVRVDRLLEVESYPAVHQLVSTVSGRLREGTRIDDVLEAAFPAGSMTGAPKLSAMTILNALEGGPRGVYSGCFGYVGRDGSADLAMVIRSIVTHPGGAYVGAGGGITWRSDAADEVAEVGIKARAPLAALGAVLPPGW